jgi:ATP-dependent DNA ligase
VIERGYEDQVAKDEASVYEAGPTKRWLKVKQKDWAVQGDRLAAPDQRGALGFAASAEPT